MRFRNMRSGFTIVELMLCIGIVSLLLAMILPAIIRVRDLASQMLSKNNMRQIMTAIHQFEGDYKRFPWLQADDGPVLVQILPYIEDQAAHRHWQQYHNSSLAIRTYLSPSDPSLSDLNRAKSLSSYAMNAQVFYATRSLSKGVPDGASYTIGIAEHYAYRIDKTNFSWAANFPTDVTFGNPPKYIYTHRATFADSGPGIITSGMIDLNDVYPVKNPKSGLTVSSIPGKTFQCRPSIETADPRIPQSPHTSMLTAMLDGSVRSLSSNIAEHVFWSIVTPAGGEAVSDDLLE